MVYQENAKQFLYRGFHMRENIRHKCERLEELRAQAERSTGNIDGVPGGRNDPHAREGVMAKLVDLQQEIEWDLLDYYDQQQRAKDLIDKIEDSEIFFVCTLRYLCHKTWQEIAEKTGYSMKNVFRLNKASIEILEGRRENVFIETHIRRDM